MSHAQTFRYSTVQVPKLPEPPRESDELADFDGTEEPPSDARDGSRFGSQSGRFLASPIHAIEEHIVYGQRVAKIYTSLMETWPSPEDVINDVDIAATILSLIVLTAPRKLPLGRVWLNAANIRRLAEQRMERGNLVFPVKGKIRAFAFPV
ncbi:hypothetical protein CERSUDRAFT_96266 [Gelatoporia subvermispora B]|uniref:Uncharacterized protein n=1 Tax=Ceriporiopsis subvermispora (strain B) TaxID=914234 RepID=M2RCB9_CERS8|nr:hypothetical protein CERSUDRAFT_96266 [Gelatoporia subvermispora B]